jgi:hypothetical protein
MIDSFAQAAARPVGLHIPYKQRILLKPPVPEDFEELAVASCLLTLSENSTQSMNMQHSVAPVPYGDDVREAMAAAKMNACASPAYSGLDNLACKGSHAVMTHLPGAAQAAHLNCNSIYAHCNGATPRARCFAGTELPMWFLVSHADARSPLSASPTHQCEPFAIVSLCAAVQTLWHMWKQGTHSASLVYAGCLSLHLAAFRVARKRCQPCAWLA